MNREKIEKEIKDENLKWLYYPDTKEFIPPSIAYWWYLDTTYKSSYKDLVNKPLLWFNPDWNLILFKEKG